MRHLILLTAICSFALTSCKQDQKTSNQNETPNLKETQVAYPLLKFEETEHDFGIMQQGEEKETTFRFENVGQGVLNIVSIKAKCGCTVPEGWTNSPVLPGGTGEFKVKFNSRGKKGNIKQPITIKANTRDGEEIVTIVANVQAN